MSNANPTVCSENSRVAWMLIPISACWYFWSRTVEAAQVARFVSSHASSASVTVCDCRDGGATVNAAATR